MAPAPIRQAAERFDRDLAEVVCLKGRGDHWRDHRGRGPRGCRRPDGRILDEIGKRLAEDGYIDAFDIAVSVQDQEVTRSEILSPLLRESPAEDITEAVPGVTHDQNSLRVHPG